MSQPWLDNQPNRQVKRSQPIGYLRMGWLRRFETFLEKNRTRPTLVAHKLVELLVEMRGHCSCHEVRGTPSIEWLHVHHGEYNARVYALLKRFDLLHRLRRVINADLKRVDLESGWGRIARQDYLAQLLTFLSQRPDQSWFVN